MTAKPTCSCNAVHEIRRGQYPAIDIVWDIFHHANERWRQQPLSPVRNKHFALAAFDESRPTTPLPHWPAMDYSEDGSRAELAVPTWSAASIVALKVVDITAKLSGWKRYQPGEGISWHTDAHRPGWRLYFVDVEQPGHSALATYCPLHDKVRSYTETGENIARVMQFPVPHAARTMTARFVGGFFIDAPNLPR